MQPHYGTESNCEIATKIMNCVTHDSPQVESRGAELEPAPAALPIVEHLALRPTPRRRHAVISGREETPLHPKPSRHGRSRRRRRTGPGGGVELYPSMQQLLRRRLPHYPRVRARVVDPVAARRYIASNSGLISRVKFRGFRWIWGRGGDC